MGEVVNVSFGRKPEDGGKARIRRRREALGVSGVIGPFDIRRFALDDEPLIETRCDLSMGHADPSDMPSDSPYPSA